MTHPSLPPLYLDWSATALLDPRALKAMIEILEQSSFVNGTAPSLANPASVHAMGRAARQRVELARQQIASSVGVAADSIIICGSATEANGLILNGWDNSGVAQLAVSAIEHSSVLQGRISSAPKLIRALPNGMIDLESLTEICAEFSPRFLVSIMLANNETGVIQPIAAAAEIIHRAGGWLHSDASQALGKIAINFNDLGVDFMTLSGQKLGAGLGAAALVRRESLHSLQPLLRGGAQENGLRAGTQNLAAIVGFGTMAALVPELVTRAQEMVAVRDALAEAARQVSPSALVIGEESPRLPQILSIAMPNFAAATQVMAFDLAGIAIGAGSACSSGTIKPSSVLTAMGLPAEIVASTVRLSLGWSCGWSCPADTVARVKAVWSSLSQMGMANRHG